MAPLNGNEPNLLRKKVDPLKFIQTITSADVPRHRGAREGGELVFAEQAARRAQKAHQSPRQLNTLEPARQSSRRREARGCLRQS